MASNLPPSVWIQSGALNNTLNQSDYVRKLTRVAQEPIAHGAGWCILSMLCYHLCGTLAWGLVVIHVLCPDYLWHLLPVTEQANAQSGT